MNKVSARKTSMVQLWFWLWINFIGWLLIGCFGCLAVSVLIVVWLGQQTGFCIIQNLIQGNFLYILKIADPNTQLFLHSWINYFNIHFTIPKMIMSQQLAYMQPHMHKMANMFFPYLSALWLGLDLLLLRLYLLLRWCPLALLFGLVGLVDGLAQRNIRRANAGRESALIYHQAKSLVFFSLMLGVFLDLVLPIQVEKAEWILVITAILFGFAIQITIKSFKKYL